MMDKKKKRWRRYGWMWGSLELKKKNLNLKIFLVDRLTLVEQSVTLRALPNYLSSLRYKVTLAP